MGWTRLEPPPKRARAAKPRKPLRVRLSATRLGTVVRIGVGAELGKRLASAEWGWVVGAKIEACLGTGADRGQLRLMPADDGDFTLRDAPGRGIGGGGFSLRLPPNVAWSDETGTWKLCEDAIVVDDTGVLTVWLPDAVLSAKAHAAPLRKAS